MAHLESSGERGAAPADHPRLIAAESLGTTRRTLSSAGIVAGLLLTWEVLVRTGALPAFYFPPPTGVLRGLGELVRSGLLLDHGSATLYRIAVGLLLGGTLGLLAGVAMGRSTPVRRVADPIVGALYPTPKLAILPLVMVFLGIGEASKLFIVGMAAFFPMLISTLSGVRQIQPIYFEVATNYGTGRLHLLKRVILPASLPAVLAGLRIALNSVIHVTIAVEIVSAVRGLGALVWLSWEVLRVEQLYATLVVISILGIASTWGLDRLTRRLIPWQS
jgi:NitT/TauT family transport system permease protein